MKISEIPRISSVSNDNSDIVINSEFVVRVSVDNDINLVLNESYEGSFSIAKLIRTVGGLEDEIDVRYSGDYDVHDDNDSVIESQNGLIANLLEGNGFVKVGGDDK